MAFAQSIASLLPDHRDIHAARKDLADGIKAWRSWWVLAENDVRQRYRRSTIGQFWVTVSMGLTILGIGVVYSVIFKHPVDKYLPFLATGLIVWSFFAGVLNDLATTFVAADVYIRSYPAPKSVLIFRTIVRNLVSMAHNLVILPILWLVFGLPLDASALLFFPGAILCLAAIFAAGLVLAPLCARFRDLPQIVQNTIQLLFFVSPVLFRPQQLGEELKFLSDYNPLANMLELLRGPLLGQVPELHHYLMVLLYAVVGYTLGFLFYARFRARIIYWL